MTFALGVLAGIVLSVSLYVAFIVSKAFQWILDLSNRKVTLKSLVAKPQATFISHDDLNRDEIEREHGEKGTPVSQFLTDETDEDESDA